eukprot:14840309-Alexandrium_andersonii.AAC.1
MVHRWAIAVVIGSTCIGACVCCFCPVVFLGKEVLQEPSDHVVLVFSRGVVMVGSAGSHGPCQSLVLPSCMKLSARSHIIDSQDRKFALEADDGESQCQSTFARKGRFFKSCSASYRKRCAASQGAPREGRQAPSALAPGPETLGEIH